MTTCELLDIQELLQKAVETLDVSYVHEALGIVNQEVAELIVYADTDSIKVTNKEEIIDGTV